MIQPSLAVVGRVKTPQDALQHPEEPPRSTDSRAQEGRGHCGLALLPDVASGRTVVGPVPSAAVNATGDASSAELARPRCAKPWFLCLDDAVVPESAGTDRAGLGRLSQ